MERNYIEDKLFEKVDFTNSAIAVGEYDNCQFVNCNFSNADLSDLYFSECEFSGCNISTVKMMKTAFKNVHFIDCKMTGLHFEQCSDFLFEVGFDACVLDLSSFYKVKLKKTVFKNCRLQEVDFVEADLTQASFENCDLQGAVFESTILEKTDFRTAYNYSMDPGMNKLKKAKFSLPAVTGLLHKYEIEIS